MKKKILLLLITDELKILTLEKNNNGSLVCIYYIAKMDGFRILCFQLMKMKLKRRWKTAT